LAIIAVFATQKLQQMLEKHYYEEFTCGTVKISFVLCMLLVQYLQFVDGDLSGKGRIVQFYPLPT